MKELRADFLGLWVAEEEKDCVLITRVDAADPFRVSVWRELGEEVLAQNLHSWWCAPKNAKQVDVLQAGIEPEEEDVTGTYSYVLRFEKKGPDGNFAPLVGDEPLADVWARSSFHKDNAAAMVGDFYEEIVMTDWISHASYQVATADQLARFRAKVPNP